MPGWLPAGVAVFIDFKNGHYYFGGAERARAETIEENADYNDFDPTLIVAGVGFQVVGTFVPFEGGEVTAGPVLTAAAKAGLLGGFTVVANVVLVAAASASSTALVQVELTDLPNYNVEWVTTTSKRRTSGGAYVDARELRDFNAVGFDDVIATAAAHKFAATLSDDHFAISTDGGAVVIATGSPVDNSGATDIGFQCLAVANSDTSTAIIESIAFYPVQADSALSALSAA